MCSKTRGVEDVFLGIEMGFTGIEISMGLTDSEWFCAENSKVVMKQLKK